jgi:phosphomannomutase
MSHSLSVHTAALAQQWLEWDIDPKTKGEVEKLVQEKNEAALHSAMSERIAFGTAGLRAEMKAGFAFMNLLTVTQATQGLVVYLDAQCPDLRRRGVVVGYDGRHNSLAFARRTAAIFASKGTAFFFFFFVFFKKNC